MYLRAAVPDSNEHIPGAFMSNVRNSGQLFIPNHRQADVIRVRGALWKLKTDWKADWFIIRAFIYSSMRKSYRGPEDRKYEPTRGKTGDNSMGRSKKTLKIKLRLMGAPSLNS